MLVPAEHARLAISGPHDGKIFCTACIRRIPDLRNDAYPNSIPDAFTDPELNYNHRKNMTDRENRILNSRHIRSYWKTKE